MQPRHVGQRQRTRGASLSKRRRLRYAPPSELPCYRLRMYPDKSGFTCTGGYQGSRIASSAPPGCQYGSGEVCLGTASFSESQFDLHITSSTGGSCSKRTGT